ncbi:MAG: winged helix-turn-helix transcriptional regulator [Candidatus Bathyarchaeota archaeon]|nr:MAG: winged helix-turn-helix transcriptional regulator [Candidatus Bathyarchaeota archaeon]
MERRSEILCLLEEDMKTAKELSTQINVTYSTILYHLHNMERRGIVNRATTKLPYKWRLTSARKRRLNHYFV